MKRILRIFAALLLTAGCFAACSSPATDEQPNAAEADADDDADTGEPDADVPDDADGGEEDADTNGDDVCEPDCSGLQCGEDPQCGESCGECDGIDVCDDGQCVEADTHATWELDGEVVYQTSTVARSIYEVSDDQIKVNISNDTVAFGRFPRVQVWVSNASEYDELKITCDSGGHDDASAGIYTGTQTPDEFPLEWHGVGASQNNCDNSVEDGEDKAEEWSFQLTEISSDELAGEFSTKIFGSGPREGSTLEVYGQIDVELTHQ